MRGRASHGANANARPHATSTFIHMRALLIATIAASAAAIHAPDPRRPLVGRAIRPNVKEELVAAKTLTPKPPGFLQVAYSACGLATTAAWVNVVRTTIRSNQPVGAMMPSMQHRLFASTSVLSVSPRAASSSKLVRSASLLT